MSALHERGISGTLALSLCLSFAAPPLATAQTTPFELGIAGSAKILCSALFVSGRDLDEAVENGAFNVELITAEQARRVTRIEVDSAGRAVSLTTDEGLTRRARYYGDQGCVILPRGRADVFFEPVRVGTELPPPGRTDWPMGDRLSDPNSVTPTLRQALDQAGDIAFESPETETVAFLVVHDGELVYERYADEVTPDMPLESWSMGKSIMATLIGVMIQQGDFRLFDPAPVPGVAGSRRRSASHPRRRSSAHEQRAWIFRRQLRPERLYGGRIPGPHHDLYRGDRCGSPLGQRTRRAPAEPPWADIATPTP